MKRFLFLLFVVVASAGAAPPFRPPAVPLVTHTPFFSIWSPEDRLTDGPTRHWTGAEQRMGSLIRVDDGTYRLMGDQPGRVPAMPQKSAEVLPLRTNYVFANEAVEVTLSFLSPLMPQDLAVLSRPVTYLTWSVRSRDERGHAVSIYFDAAAELAVDRPEQVIRSSREKADGLVVLKTGSTAQRILASKGDDHRIDWGYAYVAAPAKGARGAIGDFEDCADAFSRTGRLPAADDAGPPKPARDGEPVIALALDFGTVGADVVSRFAMIAYDEVESIRYFSENLRPYWRKDGLDVPQLLQAAAAGYERLQKAAAAFDGEMLADLRAAGGEAYAAIGALAYRQAFAAHGLAADTNGAPLFFPKENNSNGCIATVDVIYPGAPLFLLLSPALTKAMLVPILDYARGGRWPFAFAPHDLGTYPQASGQVYGGGETSGKDQMPVEESGDMLLVVAALAQAEGNADFAGRYWPTLTQWAEYLAEKGFDPENQLCTDDFAGHLAHNVNLSMKAIEALGAYAMLGRMRGDLAAAQKYRQIAERFARRWVDEAGDGDHARLAFDRPGTWSQKYNLVWDRLLGLDLFPAQVARRELAFYRRKQDAFGLPLDGRKSETKLDWTVWSGTLTGDKEDFLALVTPLRRFLDETPDRVPMTDWFMTKDSKRRGFKARSVVGGVFINLLGDSAIWKKWTARAEKTNGNWAPQPRPK